MKRSKARKLSHMKQAANLNTRGCNQEEVERIEKLYLSAFLTMFVCTHCMEVNNEHRWRLLLLFSNKLIASPIWCRFCSKQTQTETQTLFKLDWDIEEEFKIILCLLVIYEWEESVFALPGGVVRSSFLFWWAYCNMLMISSNYCFKQPIQADDLNLEENGSSRMDNKMESW